MRHFILAFAGVVLFGTGVTIGAFLSPQDMSLVGHVYQSPTSGSTIRMLLDEGNLGGKEIDIGEITFPAGVNSGEHLHGATEIFYVLSGQSSTSSTARATS